MSFCRFLERRKGRPLPSIGNFRHGHLDFSDEASKGQSTEQKVGALLVLSNFLHGTFTLWKKGQGDLSQNKISPSKYSSPPAVRTWTQSTLFSSGWSLSPIHGFRERISTIVVAALSTSSNHRAITRSTARTAGSRLLVTSHNVLCVVWSGAVRCCCLLS